MNSAQKQYAMDGEYQELILNMLEEEFNNVQGTLAMYEHQLTLPEKLRKIPAEELEEEKMKNLRLCSFQIEEAIRQFGKLKI